MHPSPHQSQAIREALSDINSGWENLIKAINNRQKELENALLHLGQFQHACFWSGSAVLTELWTHWTQSLEIHKFLKLYLLSSPVQCGHPKLCWKTDPGIWGRPERASQIQLKINELNTNWNSLFTKAENRQVELDDILREACAFSMEIQEMLLLLDWLAEKLSSLDDKTPVHGD